MDKADQAAINHAVKEAFNYGSLMRSAGEGLETIFDLIELDGSTYGLPDPAIRGLTFAAIAIAGLLKEAGPVLCEKAEMAGALDKANGGYQ